MSFPTQDGVAPGVVYGALWCAMDHVEKYITAPLDFLICLAADKQSHPLHILSIQYPFLLHPQEPNP